MCERERAIEGERERARERESERERAKEREREREREDQPNDPSSAGRAVMCGAWRCAALCAHRPTLHAETCAQIISSYFDNGMLKICNGIKTVSFVFCPCRSDGIMQAMD